jgi:type II secretory pathway pseudopilin PulG
MPYCAYCGSHVPNPANYICPSCGNPHSGAPRPAPASSSSNVIVIIAVIAGAFVLLPIMGILSAIAIPNLLTAMQRSKQKRTMADIRTVATALEARATETNDYPRASEVSELRSILTPKYMKSVPTIDGWGRPLRYECWETAQNGGKCDTYAVGSGAKDGAFEHDSLRQYESKTATTNFDCDIVYSNGSFVQYPAGVQAQ